MHPSNSSSQKPRSASFLSLACILNPVVIFSKQGGMNHPSEQKQAVEQSQGVTIMPGILIVLILGEVWWRWGIGVGHHVGLLAVTVHQLLHEIFQYGRWERLRDLAAGRDIVPCLNPTYQVLLPLYPNRVLSPDTSAHFNRDYSRTGHHLLPQTCRASCSQVCTPQEIPSPSNSQRDLLRI